MKLRDVGPLVASAQECLAAVTAKFADKSKKLGLEELREMNSQLKELIEQIENLFKKGWLWANRCRKEGGDELQKQLKFARVAVKKRFVATQRLQASA